MTRTAAALKTEPGDPFDRAGQRRDRHLADVNHARTEVTRLHDNLNDCDPSMFGDACAQLHDAEKTLREAKALVEADRVAA